MRQKLDPNLKLNSKKMKICSLRFADPSTEMFSFGTHPNKSTKYLQYNQVFNL